MLLSQLNMRFRERRCNTMLEWVGAGPQLKARETQPTCNIVFLIYLSVIVSSHVPLPVCSGVDLCIILKPYLCNRPLRVGLTCGRSRFRMQHTASAANQEKYPFTTCIIGFLLECLMAFSPVSCFWQDGDHYLNSGTDCIHILDALFSSNDHIESCFNIQNGDLVPCFSPHTLFKHFSLHSVLATIAESYL